MKGLRRSLPLLFVSAAVASACQAILGLDDATVTPSDASTDSGSNGDAPSDDAREADAAPSLEVDGPKPVHVYRGLAGTTEVTLRGTALAADATDVTITGLPAGITADPLSIAAGLGKGTLTLRASNTAPFGVALVTVNARGARGVSATATLAIVVRDYAGRIDTSFTSGIGAAGMDLTGAASLPDGKVIIAGRKLAGTKHNAVARLRLDGSLDPTFGAGGHAEASDRSDFDPNVVIDETGSIIVSGLRGQFPPRTFFVSRFDASGKLDTTFAGTSTFQALYGAGLVARGGFTYLASMATVGTTPLFVGRLGPTGFDTGFGVAGFKAASTFLYNPHLGAILADGRFLIIGPSPDGEGKTTLIRLTAAATLDTSFGDDAGAFVANRNVDRPKLALMSDGRIAMLAGGFDGTPGSGRLAMVATADGKPDTTFAQTVVAGLPEAIAVDEGDRVVVVVWGQEPPGSATYKVSIHRVLSHGEVDPFFNDGAGRVVTSSTDRVNATVIDAYRRLVIVTTSSVLRYWL